MSSGQPSRAGPSSHATSRGALRWSGRGPPQGVALFVIPALRHWKFVGGAAWLRSYLLAPFVTLGAREWAPK